MQINNNQTNTYKNNTSHKRKPIVVDYRHSNNRYYKPSLKGETNDISFKGGFYWGSIKKVFAPHVSKTHNLKENLDILSKFIGKAPLNLNDNTSNWAQIEKYLIRKNNNQQIEIVEKNWPTLLWEGIVYPIKELPLHIADWAKRKVNPNAKAKGALEALNNTDIVNSMSGYMETAGKLKHDSDAIKSANLFTRAMKMFDPKTGNYNGVHERSLTRVVTGFIPAFFLANDAYNLSRLCDDDPKEAQKEKKLRFNQEVKRVMSNAYLQLITLGALSKYINKNTGVFVGVTAVTVFITEALSRLSNGKKIHFISSEEAKAINEKEASGNSGITTEKPKYKQVNESFKSKPGFKGTEVFNNFGIVSELPFKTMELTTTAEQTPEKDNSKEFKPLLSMSMIAKWFVGVIGLGLAVRYGKNIKFGKNSVKLKDYMNVISKKYDNLYDKLTKQEFKITNTEFQKIIKKLENYDPVIAEKVQNLTYRYQKISKIKKEATNIAQELKNAGFNDLALKFEHLHNKSLNKTFKAIPAFNNAKAFFENRNNEIITEELNKLFNTIKLNGLTDEANQLKEIIFENNKVNTKNYKNALKYVKTNLKDYKTTFENRFRVDEDEVIQKMFEDSMSKLSETQPQKANELKTMVENTINEEYIKFGKKNIKGVREIADFISEPFKFIWGTITLPYKHVAKKALDLSKVELPKWEKEFDATKNLVTKLIAKDKLGFGKTNKLSLDAKEFEKYMDRQINKGFNTATMSSVSNSDLSALAKNTSTAATIWFLMADNHNMVMLKSNGKDKKTANLKAKERLVQETSRTFYNVMFINLFNNTFRSLFNSSLLGAQLVNTASTLIGENINRKAIGVPVGEKTRDEILKADKENLEDTGIKGDFFRFMSRLTGKKALTQRETSKK